MTRWPIRRRKTDYGTIILHWSLVGSLAVAVVTGLRIATEAPNRTWINALDGVLPRTTVWTTHIRAAVVLVGISLAYAIYLSLAGLVRRIRLDRVRLYGLFSRSQARWSAINVILYWMFYFTLVTQLVTGGSLYFGFANRTALNIHWLGMWAILCYGVLHVLVHGALGGLPQLLRMFRPTRLSPPPPRFDPTELFALLAQLDRPSGPRYSKEAEVPGREHSSTQAPARRGPRPEHPRRRGSVLHANPFMVATAVALVGAAFLVTIDRQATDSLRIPRVDKTVLPVLDGDTSDPIWRTVRPISVVTEHGGNFDGTGETTIEIRAVHDGAWAYFLFVWDDPTRSLKHLPLIKSREGWLLLHHGYEVGDEYAYNEDKFSVLLTRSDGVLAGDRTFHAGRGALDGKPATLSGRGLHYTVDGSFVDLWEWKATSTSPFGHMDDDHFGPPIEPSLAQLEGGAPYKGGFAADPGTANYRENFELRAPEGYSQPIQPRRLPRDYRAMMSVMGQIDLDANHGEGEGARWYMMDSESVPYAPGLDERIPLGTIIPGVIISGEFSGDRADVRCAARWAAGRWALEVARRLDTKSAYDVPISTGTYMRVAAFDHSQIRHTRHVRPIRLEVE
jgi:hypothetical protein